MAPSTKRIGFSLPVRRQCSLVIVRCHIQETMSTGHENQIRTSPSSSYISIASFVHCRLAVCAKPLSVIRFHWIDRETLDAETNPFLFVFFLFYKGSGGHPAETQKSNQHPLAGLLLFRRNPGEIDKQKDRIYKGELFLCERVVFFCIVSEQIYSHVYIICIIIKKKTHCVKNVCVCETSFAAKIKEKTIRKK